MKNVDAKDKDLVLDAVLRKLDSKYEFKGKLGAGLFTTVYLIYHKLDQEYLALKILDVDYILKTLDKSNSENSRKEFDEITKRFVAEITSSKRIQHPNIIRIFEVDYVEREDDGVNVPYIIMEYVRGEQLNRVIDQNAPIEWNRAQKVSADILDAIAGLHHHDIIHKDIKPSNIIIKEDSGQAVLIDFGITKEILHSQISITRDRPEIEAYMPPEQFMDESNINKSTDIYAFGVIFYEMLTGEKPFTGKSIYEKIRSISEDPIPDITQKRSDLPPGVEEIIFKALAKKPLDRYQEAGEVIAALQEIIKTTQPTPEETVVEEIETVPQVELEEWMKDPELADVLEEIKGNYDLKSLLDEGGWGKVYLVYHKFFKENRVLKVMRQEFFAKAEKDDPGIKNNFLREAQLLSKIDQPNIVRVFDVGLAGEQNIPYFIMEYVEGNKLDHFIENNLLDHQKIKKIAVDILSALQVMHGNTPPIIHRDIKPANIIIKEEDGEIQKAVLIDYGLAKDTDDPLQRSGDVGTLGTPLYMSPELWEGKEAGAATDIYSMGIVLYQMLTGKLPFKGENPAELKQAHLQAPIPDLREKNPKLSLAIKKLIEKAMSKDALDRFAKAEDFITALTTVQYEEIEPEAVEETPIETGETTEKVKPKAKKTRKKKQEEKEKEKEAEKSWEEQIKEWEKRQMQEIKAEKERLQEQQEVKETVEEEKVEEKKKVEKRVEKKIEKKVEEKVEKKQEIKAKVKVERKKQERPEDAMRRRKRAELRNFFIALALTLAAVVVIVLLITSSH